MLYFGTDGIRAHHESLFFSHETLVLVGQALALWNQKKNNRSHQVLCIHDTRKSAKKILAGLAQGLNELNHTVFDGGVLPTPAAHWIMGKKEFDFTLILTASHNPPNDNGIKILIPGKKITLDDEATIEHHLTTLLLRKNKQKINNAKHSTIDFAQEAKQIYLNTFNDHVPLPKLEHKKIVIDCANGAMCSIAQELFSPTQAKIIYISNQPNGDNINQACGATHPETLIKTIKTHNADLGFSFDGDGDRIIAANKEGTLKTGDDILCILSRHPKLNNATNVIGTVMTNNGFDKYLNTHNKKLIRTAIGDRAVITAMHKHKAQLGGEPGGHVIIQPGIQSSDGGAAARWILDTCLFEEDYSLKSFLPYIQLHKSIPVLFKHDFTQHPLYKKILDNVSQRLPQGRALIRYSGTEPLLRIMVENPNQEDAKTVLTELTQTMQTILS